MLRIFGIFIIQFVLTSLLYSQEDNSNSGSIVELIKKQLEVSDLHKLEKIEKEEQDASIKMIDINKDYEELNKKKQEIESQTDRKIREGLLKKSLKFENEIIRDHIKVLETEGICYIKRYELYRDDIKRQLASGTITSGGEVDELIKLALECDEKADLQQQKVIHTDNTDELFKIFVEAHKQEKLGILYEEKVYSIILNWDSSIQKSIDEQIAALLSGKPTKDDENEQNITQNKDSVKVITKVIHDTIKVEQTMQNPVLYKVQIAASKTPLSIEKIKSIYPENTQVQYEIDNNWYKYSVGYFFYYQDAKNLKTKIGVKGAFIIAYKNEKKVPIQDLINHPSYLKQN